MILGLFLKLYLLSFAQNSFLYIWKHKKILNPYWVKYEYVFWFASLLPVVHSTPVCQTASMRSSCLSKCLLWWQNEMQNIPLLLYWCLNSNFLTVSCTCPLQKVPVIVAQFVNKISFSHGSRWFVTVFTVSTIWYCSSGGVLYLLTPYLLKLRINNFCITNLMHKLLVYLHIIHHLKSSTCFEHYPAHLQEVYVVIVYMQPLVLSLYSGDCLVHRSQSPAESDDTRDCIYTITTWTSWRWAG
jgi:hypothetical protein